MGYFKYIIVFGQIFSCSYSQDFFHNFLIHSVAVEGKKSDHAYCHLHKVSVVKGWDCKCNVPSNFLLLLNRAQPKQNVTAVILNGQWVVQDPGRLQIAAERGFLC